MIIHRKLMLIGIVATVVGLTGLAPFAYFWSQNKIAQANPGNTIVIPKTAPQPAPKASLITGKPIRLQIPSLGLDLAVVDGAYDAKSGAWTLSLDKAHYALPTAQPNNEEGNTLIYGHYRQAVFAGLHTIAAGAQAIVLTDNGYRFVYAYQDTQTVDPSDTSIFTYHGAPRLTLQTCSGALFQHRQFFYFSLTGVEKIPATP